MYNDKNKNIMKFRNVMSAILLAGAFTMASCSQEEELSVLSQNNTQKTLRITVSDTGVYGESSTRAVEDGYKTTFEIGDAIGVYAINIKEGRIIEENRKFEYKEDGTWELALGQAIEYIESEMENMKFYAYYPYQSNGANFNLPNELKDDPFAEAVKTWEIKYSELADNYTKYDLMTSVATDLASDGALGYVNFELNHRMSMALIALPTKTYNFINEDDKIEPYSLPAIPGSFVIEQGDINMKVNPYYDKKNDMYRILVKPNEEYTISGGYTLGQRMTFTRTLPAVRSKAGTAVKFKLKGSQVINHNLQIGDYYCADGSIVAAGESAPKNAIGVVYFVGNPQPSVLYSASNKYTEYNDIMRNDFPNCKHALVIALQNANNGVASKFSSKKGIAVDSWKNDKYEEGGRYINLQYDPKKILDKSVLTDMKGYNNTKLLKMSQIDEEIGKRSDVMCSVLDKYEISVPSPSMSTGWFCPSHGDFNSVIKNFDAIKTSIEVAGGSLERNPDIFSVAWNAIKNAYWASTIRNDDAQWVTGLNAEEKDGAKETLGMCEKNSQYFRFCLAF